MKPDGSFYSDEEIEAAEFEAAKASVRRTQEAAGDMARIARPQCGGQLRCAGCGCTYEDTPGNFCSFCA